MRQGPFEATHTAEWADYRRLLTALEDRGRDPSPDLMARFPTLYRRLCAHYALARARRYAPGLIAELHDLVRRGYPHLYRRRSAWLAPTLGFMAADFPRTLRRHARVCALAAALFFLPLLVMGLACGQDGELIYSLMDAAQVAELESMYDPAGGKPGRVSERQADTDLRMFGFYVKNNIGVGFRTFGAGLLLGLGSVLILIYNGLAIGAAAGHLTRLGFGATFWPFVSSHSPFELTAIAISGAAGLLLGRAPDCPWTADPAHRPARERSGCGGTGGRGGPHAAVGGGDGGLLVCEWGTGGGEVRDGGAGLGGGGVVFCLGGTPHERRANPRCPQGGPWSLTG